MIFITFFFFFFKPEVKQQQFHCELIFRGEKDTHD